MKGFAGTRAVVTGAGRGLGLEFTRQLLAAGAEVFALARKPDRSPGLESLQEAHPRALRVARADVTDEALIGAAHEAIRSVWDGIDLLINNAGTYGRHDATLSSLDRDELIGVFDVNVLGPLRVTRILLDLIRRGRSPRVVNLSSLMGSIADNHSGGSWAYRISKAALNMATRNLAHELTPLGIVAVALHPGWVRTDMGGENAPLAPQEAVEAMLATIGRLGPDQAGRFLDRNGHPLPY